MEKQERTGYSALHKLLQGLPVPVHNTAGCMTQAEAFEGGFTLETNLGAIRTTPRVKLQR